MHSWHSYQMPFRLWEMSHLMYVLFGPFLCTLTQSSVSPRLTSIRETLLAIGFQRPSLPRKPSKTTQIGPMPSRNRQRSKQNRLKVLTRAQMRQFEPVTQDQNAPNRRWRTGKTFLLPSGLESTSRMRQILRNLIRYLMLQDRRT